LVDAWTLLHSYAFSAPGLSDFIFVDLPRASANGSAQVFAIDANEDIIKKEIRWEDPDYLTLISASYILTARMCRQAISSSGVVAISTNWQHYTLARTAFEISFGVKNCLGELVYQTREGGGNDSKFLSIDHESLLIFSNAPQNISPFHVPKSHEELLKYKLEDENGRYTWDTFIRKQAKTYYPITCPDGTVLEFDDNGDRISWLRGKDRFAADLAQGEIEFRKHGGKWKLYYKDRLKESKILRSVSLSSDLGNEIFENLEEETSKSLLTKHGTAEIKGKAEKAPPYLKSQRYFKFIFNALAKSAKNILVPFPEHGSAALGVLTSSSSAKLATSVDLAYSALWTSRVSSMFGEASLVKPDFLKFKEIASPKNTATACRAVVDLLRFKFRLSSEPTTLETSAAEGTIASINDGERALIVYVGLPENFSRLFDDLTDLAPDLAGSKHIEIYTTSEPPGESILKLQTKPDIHLIPAGSVC
jgi:hypothetical protein